MSELPYPCCDKMCGPAWIDGRYCRPVCDVHGYQTDPRTPPAADAEPVAWLYEHPAIGRFQATERWRTDDVTEMWTETPLYTADQLQAYGDARAREPERMLADLLAVIHHDGGHRQDEIGTEQAWMEAMMLVPTLLALKENLNG